AGFICVFGFALHAFFDVPGHHVGALWPVLLLAATALNPRVEFHRSRAVSIIFRLIGTFLIAVGIWWSASAFGASVLPTTTSLSRTLREIDNASEREDYETMLKRASSASKIAPLNWVSYFKRGVAEAALYRPRAEILRDFAAARYLLPNWADLYVK